MTKGGWFFEEKLLPFLIILSRIASYDLELFDWDAITYGVCGTSESEGKWFSYEFEGQTKLPFKLARNSEDNYIIRYNVDVPADLEKSVDLMDLVLEDFALTPVHFKTTSL